jgi:hypothetical protein
VSALGKLIDFNRVHPIPYRVHPILAHQVGAGRVPFISHWVRGREMHLDRWTALGARAAPAAPAAAPAATLAAAAALEGTPAP